MSSPAHARRGTVPAKYCTPRQPCRYRIGIDGDCRCRPQAASSFAPAAGPRSMFVAVVTAERFTAKVTALEPHASLREAAQRYQRSRHGRMTHAERMRRYRSRQNKVTHHGSAVPAADALLAPTSTTSAARAAVPTSATPVPEHCHFCHCVCPGLLTPRATAPSGLP